MITTMTASELRVGMTVHLSGRSPQKVTGIAEQFSPTYGSSFKVWLERVTVDWCSAGFKFNIEVPDETKDELVVSFLLPPELNEQWIDAILQAFRA